MRLSIFTKAALLIALLVVTALAAIVCAPPEATPETPSQTPPRTITLVTYNVLANPIAVDSRIPPLLDILKKSDADIIALQEVVPWFIERLEKQPWSGKYHRLKIEGSTVAPRGELILSKFPIERWIHRTMPGGQRRGVVIAYIQVDGRPLAVATTHMESFLKDGPVRARQLDFIFSLMPKEGDAVLLGDLNFGDGEQPETDRLPKEYVDAWLKLKPDDPGYTWNMETSGLARKSAFQNETSRRIDRVLMRSTAWRAREVRIIGDQPVTPGDASMFPSDHFGLTAVFERKE